ncbi:cytochrome C oxidase Cbb3 [Xanthovirga aplysinae]|uniref:cytochrome C oxidase Cbb3 n=1 Tax=Xanthovirga aplysinae TaxID=2529853 RepID=UPI0012BD04A9|nr:cytochrome C oxidase Cbb3 [Xanthovirga aplysinae]MTI31569.1 cytochrome C oxidase Cbb3 [Xanthovirga aplysinae]
MFKHYFEQVQNIEVGPLISLMIFFLFFLGLIIWSFTTDKRYFNRMGQLPLEEDNFSKASKKDSYE